MSRAKADTACCVLHAVLSCTSLTDGSVTSVVASKISVKKTRSPFPNGATTRSTAKPQIARRERLKFAPPRDGPNDKPPSAGRYRGMWNGVDQKWARFGGDGALLCLDQHLFSVISP